MRKAAAAAAKAGEGVERAIPASEADRMAEEDWEVEEGLEGEGEGEAADEEQEAIVDIMYTLASTYAKNGEFTQAQPLYTELIAFRRAEQPVNPIKLSRGACVCVCVCRFVCV